MPDITTVLAYTSGVCLVGAAMVANRMRGTTNWAKMTRAGHRHRVAVVTGASCGIGKETATEFARRGMRVIIACKDLESGEEAAEDIRQNMNNPNVFAVQCDLASFASIRSFAKSFSETEERLDILVNNAAVFRCPYMLTEDGLEMQMGTNYFGHFLLTNLLLPKMKYDSLNLRPRVVNVTTSFHRYGVLDFDNLNSEKYYDSAKAFYNSKLALNLFAIELSKRTVTSGINVYCAEPVFSRTYLDRYVQLPIKEKIAMLLLGKKPREGAQTVTYCAGDPRCELDTGRYYYNCELMPWSDTVVKHLNQAEHLWNVSKQITKLEKTIGDP